jgi:hypothetical protein
VSEVPRETMPKRVRDELAGWQEMARAWPLRFTLTDLHGRCEACDQSVIPLVDESGQWFTYDPAQLLVLAVAHIRQVHAGKQPV